MDRGVLLQKLKDMNFPAPFLRYLTDYYFLDNISTATPGVTTRKQYQNRGLRQGCNLSSVLFVLYVSDLPTHLLAQGVGVRLPSGELVCVLLFADDIVLIAISLPDLDILKTSLERWSLAAKMTISIPKTNVVTPVSDYVCVISNASTDSHDVVSNVANYKYLGIHQYGSLYYSS